MTDGSNGDRWATMLVGCNWWGTRLADALDECESARLAAVVDRRTDRAESVAEDRDAAVFADHERAIVDLELDAAVLAIPPSEHADVTIDCLDAGLHTYLEKPAGALDDPAEILRLGDRAAENGVSLMPGYSQRFHPYVSETIDAVRSGAIGEVRSIDVRRQTDWKPDPDDAPGWGIHDYDVCCVLAGSPPGEIHPFSTSVDGRPDPTTTEVLIEHENGVLSRCRTHTSAEAFEVFLRVHGEGGEIVGNRREQSVRATTGDSEWKTTYDEAPPFEVRAIAAFFESLDAGETPPVTPEEVVHGRRVETTVYETLGLLR